MLVGAFIKRRRAAHDKWTHPHVSSPYVKRRPVQASFHFSCHHRTVKSHVKSPRARVLGFPAIQHFDVHCRLSFRQQSELIGSYPNQFMWRSGCEMFIICKRANFAYRYSPLRYVLHQQPRSRRGKPVGAAHLISTR